MSAYSDPMHVRTSPALVGLTGIIGLASAVSLTTAAAEQAGQSCGPAHRYVDAASATVKPHRVIVTGKHSKLVCGGPDDSSYVDGSAVTLKVLRSATIRVWKVPADPSQGMRTVAATALPHWLRKNRSEPIYKIHGPADGVTKLVERWHP